MSEPKIYKHKPFQLIILVILLPIMGIVLFTSGGTEERIIQTVMAVMIGVVFLVSMLTLTVKVIISDSEISTQSIFGTKSLAWSEINRVSGTGSALKLHNREGDVTVAPSPQLPGYVEIIEQIGAKRADLFNTENFGEMKRSWFVFFPLILLIVFFMAGLLVSGLMMFNKPDTPTIIIMPLFFIFFIAVIFLGIVFSSPQSVTLEGKSMSIKYLFSERTLLADEIASIELRFTQTRNGKNYFVALNQTNRKTIRISGLSISLPIVYLVLKNWHKKYTNPSPAKADTSFNYPSFPTL